MLLIIYWIKILTILFIRASMKYKYKYKYANLFLCGNSRNSRKQIFCIIFHLLFTIYIREYYFLMIYV